MTALVPSTSAASTTAAPVTVVTDNPQRARFELGQDGSVAYAAYQLQDASITFTHTFVPTSLRGRGLATQLVLAGLQSSRARGLKVIPQCPVFRAYMKGHPETHDLLGPEGRALIEE